jgi:hypothetical protein
MDDNRPSPEQSLTAILARVVAAEDSDRLRSLTNLLNTFNFAVEQQAGKSQWDVKDFRLFAVALCAIDQVGNPPPLGELQRHEQQE